MMATSCRGISGLVVCSLTSLVELLASCCMAELQCKSCGGRTAGAATESGRCDRVVCDQEPALLRARRDKPTLLVLRLSVELLRTDTGVTLPVGAGQLPLASMFWGGTGAGVTACAVIDALAVTNVTSAPCCAFPSRPGDGWRLDGDEALISGSVVVRPSASVTAASRS